MKLLGRFDTWVQQGPFTPLDLGFYRIIYSACALLILPSITWLAEYPDSLIQPPPGPFQLLSGFPSPAVLIVLEVLRAFTLVLLGLGVWTRLMSIAVAVMLLITYGLTYSLGKIDHTILLVLVPLILAFANWGSRLSIDALRGEQGALPQPQWPLRLLAFAIGLSFFAAAGVKIATGWLSLNTQAAQGHFLIRYLIEGRTSWLAETASNLNLSPAWELLDWLTVVIELAVLATLPWWRAFRTALALTAVFHLGVLLLMDIAFAWNIVAYGAFVSWGALNIPSTSRAAASLRSPVGKACLWIFVPVATAAAWVLAHTTVNDIASTAILFVGAGTGLTYVTHQFIYAAKRQTKKVASRR